MNKKQVAYNTSFKDYVDYGVDVIRHKHDVYKAGKKLNVSKWALFKHDIDKFLPKRYKTYAEWFYGDEGQKGSKNPELRKKWRKEVQKHYMFSPHHANKVDKKKTVEAELESLADWYSATQRAMGYSKNFKPFSVWIEKNIDKFKISPEAKIIAKDIVKRT